MIRSIRLERTSPDTRLKRTKVRFENGLKGCSGTTGHLREVLFIRLLNDL